MAKGPKELLEIREDDIEAVKKMEAFIDADQGLIDYDGKEIQVIIPEELWVNLFGIRTSLRRNQLYQLYKKAGWVTVYVNGPGEDNGPSANASITLSQWDSD